MGQYLSSKKEPLPSHIRTKWMRAGTSPAPTLLLRPSLHLVQLYINIIQTPRPPNYSEILINPLEAAQQIMSMVNLHFTAWPTSSSFLTQFYIDDRNWKTSR